MQEEKQQQEKQSFAKGLFAFLKEYSVIGLAIGVIVAQISKDLIDSIVKGIFTPFIQLIIPGGGFQNLAFYIKDVKFDAGLIISNFLTFIIVLTILYILIKKILKKEDLLKK
jgi:large-conductance mechanosensitive channel